MARKSYRDAFVSAHLSNTVAAQISGLRQAKNWKQKDLAEKAGMKQSRISALEDPNYENIEIGTLKKLASAFDVGLTIRFVPFSELARWSVTLTEDKLVIADFEHDECIEAQRLEPIPRDIKADPPGSAIILKSPVPPPPKISAPAPV